MQRNSSFLVACFVFSPIVAYESESAAMDLSKEKQTLESELVMKYGEAEKARIRRGLEQVAKLWRDNDGDFAEFVRAHFMPARSEERR